MPRHTRSPLFIRAKLWWLVVVRICAQVLSGFVKRKESGGEEKKESELIYICKGLGNEINQDLPPLSNCFQDIPVPLYSVGIYILIRRERYAPSEYGSKIKRYIAKKRGEKR